MSGGLSSLVVSKWLTDQGIETLNFIADIGQVDQVKPGALADLLGSKGMSSQVVDLRADMADMALELVRYQATYEGDYWNTTGASRAVLVKGLARSMKEQGCTVLAHGCVGGGNDQARFERYTRALAPDLEVFVPWQDPDLLGRFPSRAAMAESLRAAGLLDEDQDKANYSTDANLAGVSHEGTALEDLRTPSTAARPLLGVWPQQAPDAIESVRIRFEQGRAVELNGRRVTPLECLMTANQVAGRNGLWMQDVLENRVNGTKCRGVYESPGLTLLGHGFRRLYQAVVEKQAAQLYESLSPLVGRQVYEGRYLEVASRAACAALDVVTEHVTGTVEVGLYKGNVFFHALTDFTPSPNASRQTRFSGGGHFWQTR